MAFHSSVRPATGVWSTGAFIPTPRISLSVAVVDDQLYALGGEENSDYMALSYANERYTPFGYSGPSLETPTPSPSPTPSTLTTPIPTPTSTLTKSPSPSASVPEFPTWIALPTIAMVTMLSAIAIKRKTPP